jgi:hypothetical protein
VRLVDRERRKQHGGAETRALAASFVTWLVLFAGVAIALAGGMLALRACGAGPPERPHLPLPLPPPLPPPSRNDAPLPGSARLPRVVLFDRDGTVLTFEGSPPGPGRTALERAMLELFAARVRCAAERLRSATAV